MPARHITNRPERGNTMANKYSKSNNSGRAQENRSMQKYEEQRKRLNTGAKIMAILVAAAMVITTFLASGLFIFD